MDAKSETRCDGDQHKRFEYYIDFNEWLDSEEALGAREVYGVDGISVPSKAFYAGDKEAYDQAFKEYRENRRNEALSERYLCDQFTDNHWFERNLQRFDQLVEVLEAGDVVPFIGCCTYFWSPLGSTLERQVSRARHQSLIGESKTSRLSPRNRRPVTGLVHMVLGVI